MPPESLLLAEFELYLDFARGTADPQRVFRTLTRVLEVLGTLDDTLVRLLDAELSTELALQDVEAGSIRTRIAIWLKPLVTGDLGQAIKEGNVKKIIGGFINKTLLFIIRYLENRQGLDTPEELRYLKDNIDRLTAEAAREAEISLLTVGTLPVGLLADWISNLTKALAALTPQDALAYVTPQGRARFNPRFQTENLSALAGAQQESSTQRHVRLRIKKPDFLGESKWDFRRLDDHPLAAKITDDPWLADFHAGHITIRSGDLLEVDQRRGARQRRGPHLFFIRPHFPAASGRAAVW